jgi:DNA-binding IclR family transcriptional regulator
VAYSGGPLHRVGTAWDWFRGFYRRQDALELEASRDELNDTVQLAVLEGTGTVSVAKVEADHALRLVSHVGPRLPDYATELGKVLVAYLEPVEFREGMSTVRIQPFTSRTVTSVDALESQPKEIRAKGYGEDEGEYTVGVRWHATRARRTAASNDAARPFALR